MEQVLVGGRYRILEPLGEAVGPLEGLDPPGAKVWPPTRDIDRQFGAFAGRF